MKRRKVFMATAMALVLSGASLAGCAKPENKAEQTAETSAAASSADAMESKDGSSSDDKLSVVCTIFPEYDWVREITKEKSENFELTLLLDNGIDLHSYQPTAEDIAKIAECDLFVYVGGESDGWVDDALAEATNKDMQVVNLLEALGDDVKTEELKEGMQEGEHHHNHEHEEHADEEHKHEHEEHADEEHKHEHEEHADEEHKHEHHHEHGDEPELDEHVWLSLNKAIKLVNHIETAIEAIDKDNAEVYKASAKEYTDKLAELDKQYRETVENAKFKTVVFGDRFPFRYMVDDYGLDYYAAFVGCSAETEASFETVIFLADKVDELGIGNILTIEKSDQKIAKTILDNTSSKEQGIYEMDSMQSITADDVKAGETYIGIMEDNLKVLKAALN